MLLLLMPASGMGIILAGVLFLLGAGVMLIIKLPKSSTYSMASYLKQTYNYKAVAMHPYLSSGWNRPATYQNFGFDACYFYEDFPKEKYIRQYISDQEMFEFLIKKYEELKDEPLFIFGITMQNHGDYLYDGENYTKHIYLSEHERA